MRFKSMFAKWLSFVCLGFGLLCLAGCGWNQYRASIDQSMVISHIEGTDLDVQSQNGAIEILTDASLTQVFIEATLTCGGTSQAQADQRLQDARLVVERSTDRTLRIAPAFPAGMYSNDGARITVRLPDVGSVNVDTGNGRIELSGARGDSTLTTSNGTVMVADHHGTLRINTSNGRIDITDLHGDLTARTSNGRVHIVEAHGQVQVDTSNGSIDCAMAPVAHGPVNLGTSNGRIELTIGHAFEGTLDIDTSNGSVDVDGRLDAARRVITKKSSGTVEMATSDARSVLRSSNGPINVTIVDDGTSAEVVQSDAD